MYRCQATTLKGSQCHHHIKFGQKYCSQHQSIKQIENDLYPLSKNNCDKHQSGAGHQPTESHKKTRYEYGAPQVFEALPPDIIRHICEQMNDEALHRFIQTKRIHKKVCEPVRAKRICERKTNPELRQFFIDNKNESSVLYKECARVQNARILGQYNLIVNLSEIYGRVETMRGNQTINDYMKEVSKQNWEYCSMENAIQQMEKNDGSCRLYFRGGDIFNSYVYARLYGNMDNTVVSLYIPRLRQLYIDLIHPPNLTQKDIPQFENASSKTQLHRFYVAPVEYAMIVGKLTPYDVLRFTGPHIFQVLLRIKYSVPDDFNIKSGNDYYIVPLTTINIGDHLINIGFRFCRNDFDSLDSSWNLLTKTPKILEKWLL
jgi:hypothetical protein